MARHGPLKKPTMSQMPVLLFLADNPDLLIVSSSVMTSSSYHFAYKDGTRYRHKGDQWTTFWDGDEEPEYFKNAPAPEVPKNLAIHRWLQSDWIKRVEKEGEKWSWYSHPYRMTKSGREIADKWRAKYQEHLAKKREEQKEVERCVAVRTRGYRGSRRYGALLKVLRVTKTRLYVERVKGPSGYCETIHGRRGHEYVEIADVTMDPCTPDQFDAIYRVETSKLEWLAEVKSQEDEEVAAVRDRYQIRREQNQHMFEDEIREALATVKETT